MEHFHVNLKVFQVEELSETSFDNHVNRTGIMFLEIRICSEFSHKMLAKWRVGFKQTGLVTIGLAVLMGLHGGQAFAQAIQKLDLLQISEDSSVLERVYGHDNNGRFGVPVATGYDVNGDGHMDYAVAAMLGNPQGRTEAGEVFLILGTGEIGGSIDTGLENSRVLPIQGSANYEHTGSEIWMAEVTGDSLGDLIICRQDYSQTAGSGEGAMTIIPGQAALTTLAQTNGGHIDLADDNSSLNLTTIVGANGGVNRQGDRFCMWARNGDLDNDGIDDIAVSADQEDSHGLSNSGAVYVFRGGSHLSGAGEVDMEDFGTSEGLLGNVMKIIPPADPSANVNVDGGTASSPTPDTSSVNFHLGATLNIANLDNVGGAELMVSAALNRAGGNLTPTATRNGFGSGGSCNGTVYIVWEDNFTGDWDPAPVLDLYNLPGSVSVIDGYDQEPQNFCSGGGTPTKRNNKSFGEELLGGLDFDNDGNADLFAGDLVADSIPGIPFSRFNAGSGHVLYNASLLKNEVFNMDSPVSGLNVSNFLGPIDGAIDGDTAFQGDFNGDGIDDLAFSAPHDAEFGRTNSGTLHIFLGRDGARWPQTIDLLPSQFPQTQEVQMVNIIGRFGNSTGNIGDTLAYSGATGDIDNDGYMDIATNEMVGDGASPGTIDVGNLILISGKDLFEYLETLRNQFCVPIIALSGAIATVCF